MKKKPGDIIILHMCTKNYDQMIYGSWDIVWDRRTDRWMIDGWEKWHNIEVGAPPKKAWVQAFYYMLFTDYASGIWLLDCSKLAINHKNETDIIIRQHKVITDFFLTLFCFSSQFSYWPKFHVNIITGSRVMRILFYRGLTRNPEIKNTLVLVMPNISRLGQVRDTKFGRNVFIEILLNAAKCQHNSFYCFWVIKGKLTEG